MSRGQWYQKDSGRADNMAKKWVKLYPLDYLDGEARVLLTPLERDVFISLICLAALYEQRGTPPGLITLSPKAIAHRICVSEAEYYESMAKLGSVGVGDPYALIDENEHTYLPGYATRQAVNRWDIWADKNPEKATQDRHKPEEQEELGNTKKPKESPDPSTEPEVIATMEGLAKIRNFPSANKYKESWAIHDLLQDYSISLILCAYADIKKHDKFWKKKPLSVMKLRDLIGEWLEEVLKLGNQGSNRLREQQQIAYDTLPEENSTTVEEVNARA